MATTPPGNFRNPQPPPAEMSVWVYGKANPGWYIARWKPDYTYAEHLKALGYEVRMSLEKPVE